MNSETTVGAARKVEGFVASGAAAKGLEQSCSRRPTMNAREK